MIIDTHAHLLYNNCENVIKNMEANRIEKIITIGTDSKNSCQSVELAKSNKNIYAAVGIHPDYASLVTNEDLEVIDKLASEEKVVAIGEIGLDYHSRQDNKEIQKQVFIKQMEIAKKHNLPICIHSRDAKEDTYEILKENKNLIVVPSVMHCYSYDFEYAKKFIELGFYISFAGNITYKKTDRSYLKQLPLDRILVETDCPFLPPEPLRGTVNEPKNVYLTARKISDVLEMDEEEFRNITIENAYRVFKKMKRN